MNMKLTQQKANKPHPKPDDGHELGILEPRIHVSASSGARSDGATRSGYGRDGRQREKRCLRDQEKMDEKCERESNINMELTQENFQ